MSFVNYNLLYSGPIEFRIVTGEFSSTKFKIEEQQIIVDMKIETLLNSVKST